MIIRLAGIHNLSKHTLVVKHFDNECKPEILLARLVSNNGKRMGTSEVPISDYYNTKSDSTNPPPIFEPTTLLIAEPKGYARFLNFYVNPTKQFLNFYLEINKIKQENTLSVKTIIKGNYLYIEYTSTNLEVCRSLCLGETSSELTIDLYITLSDTEGFLVEPMNAEVKHLRLEAFVIGKLLYAYLLSKTNVVYLPVESTDVLYLSPETSISKSFQVFLYKAEEFQNPVSNKPRIELKALTSIEDKALDEQYKNNGGKYWGDVLFAPQTCISVKDPTTGRKVALNKMELTLTCDYTPEAIHQGLFATTRINYLIRLENDKANTVILWRIEQAKEFNHQIDSITGLLKLDAKALGKPIKLIAKIEVRFEIKLPKRFPLLMQRNTNEANWLADSNGQKAIKHLYAIYKNLNDAQKESIKGLKLYLLYFTSNATQYELFTNAILFKNDELKGDSSSISYQWMRLLSEVLIHAKLKKAGLTPNEIYANILKYNYYATMPLLNLPYYTDSSFVNIIIPPFYFISYLFDLYEQSLSVIKDDVTEFSQQTGWEMRNFNFKTIPLIGWFCNTFLKMPPNYIYSVLANNSFHRMHFGLSNKNLKDNEWKEAGMSSELASFSPIPDMIESFATSAFDEQVFNKLIPEKKQPNIARQEFIKKTYLDTKWKKLTLEQLEFYKDMTFSSNYDWASSLSIGSQAETVEQTRLAAAQKAFQLLSLNYENKENTVLQNKRQQLDELCKKNAIQISKSLGFLQLSEKYGNGLHPFKGADYKSEVGDVLIDKELIATSRGISMVAQTDTSIGRVLQVYGMIDLKRSFNQSSFIKPISDYTLTWVPSIIARKWDNSVYPNINKAFSALIDLWGSETDAKSNKPVHTAGHFFDVFLDMSELRIPNLTFPTADFQINMRNYMHISGNGIQLYDSKKTNLEVGDIIIPYHENTIGVVLRLRDNVSVDVLMSGGHPREKGHRHGIGETNNMVKLLHAYEKDNIKYYWKPSTQLQQFYTPKK
jgi:hypothetical protein